jgi:nucleotide-binding universal stress UspA family protein
MKIIVVGVDGSEQGNVALGFAAEEAAMRSASLRVVCAWEVPTIVAPLIAYPPEPIEPFREDAEGIVRTALAKVAELQPSVACEGKAVLGHPAEVLLTEAESAGMIVVGHRGRGGFASLMLGSVTHHVVNHARCPVIVVRKAESSA